MNTDTGFGRTTLIAAAPRTGQPTDIISAGRPCTGVATTKGWVNFITQRSKRNENGNTQRIKTHGWVMMKQATRQCYDVCQYEVILQHRSEHRSEGEMRNEGRHDSMMNRDGGETLRVGPSAWRWSDTGTGRPDTRRTRERLIHSKGLFTY